METLDIANVLLQLDIVTSIVTLIGVILAFLVSKLPKVVRGFVTKVIDKTDAELDKKVND